MQHHHLVTSIIGFFILQTITFAQIQFSGFADILLVTPLEAQSEADFQQGQIELDISATIRPGINFEGAIALNPETGTFETGAGFIEMVLTGEDGLHAARGNSFNHIGLSIGQFDVPFGIVCQHIASPDRRLVSAPLLNEKSINGWNDLGINLHADLGKFQFTSFLVNGSAEGFAIGGRSAIKPIEAFELGISYFSQTAANDLDSQPQVLGVDLQTVTGPLSTRMEVHYTEDLFEGDFGEIDSVNTHQGYYIQGDFDLSEILDIPLVLIGRYDDWSTENDAESANRITLGAAYNFYDGFELRAEYLNDTTSEEDDYNQFVIQALVSF